MKKTIFALVASTILLLLVAYPVVALEIYEYQTSETLVRIRYEDGSYGNIPVNTTDYVFDDWPQYWVVDIGGNEVYNESMTIGVQFGAFFENEAEVRPRDLSSVSASYTMYTIGPHIPSNIGFGYVPVTTCVPLIQYYFELSPHDVMNGVQEMWYRSPVKWDDDYQYYYINIWDTETDTLVYAGEYGSSYNDRGISFVEDERLYFKLNFKLFSANRYRVVEGAYTVDTNPITSVNVFFANNQDIANDDEMDSYIFPGTPQSRKFECLELSWSMACIVGIGHGGTEKLLRLSNIVNSAEDFIEIWSHDMYGSLNDVDYLNVTIPFRFTEPTDIEVRIATYGDASDLSAAGHFSAAIVYNDLTGIFRATIPITDTDPTEPNMYRIRIRVLNISSTDHFMTYTMVPTTGVFHKVGVYNGSAYRQIALPHFAMHIEVEEGVTPVAPVDNSIRWDTVLLGVAAIIVGVLAATVGVFVSPTGVGLLLIPIGVGLIIGGAMTVKEGLLGVAPGDTTMANMLRYLVDGAVRIGRTVWEGLNWIAENLWDAMLWVIEQVQVLGAGIMTFLEIAIDFIFFILFMGVVWFWAKFLKVMDGVVAGDMDKALATTQQMITKPTRVVRRYVDRPVRKGAKRVLKWKTGGKK